MLQNCPFCGGVANIYRFGPHEHMLAAYMPVHKGSVTVECDDCPCAMIAETEEEVINLWNERK